MLYFYRIAFLKELILIKQLHQNSVIFVTICIFKTKFEFQPYECNKCHDLLLMSMSLSNVAILRIKTINYCCIITGSSKFEAMKLLLKISWEHISNLKKTIIKFREIEIEKQKFQQHKRPILIKDSI